MTKDMTPEQRQLVKDMALKELQKQKKKFVTKPMEGYTWNPLLTLPRNSKCPCRSGAKFKHCCMPKMPKAVTLAEAKKYREQMALPDLTFNILPPIGEEKK